MLRQSLKKELAAATATAAKLGLGVVKPEVLHLGNHTTAKLTPLPIVARIASGTSFDFSHGSLSRELTIAAHLASRDAPSVRPVSKLAPGPYLASKCAITLWDLVDGRASSSEQDAFTAAASLKRLHLALAEVPGEVRADLPSFITKVESCEDILANPAQAPKLAANDRLFLEKAYETLRNELSGITGAWQPLHGDTHLGNVMMTRSGAIWMDLESVCLGPLEWDVVNLPVETWAKFPGMDVELLQLFAGVRSLCVAVWCWAEFDRNEATADAAVHHLAELKGRFG